MAARLLFRDNQGRDGAVDLDPRTPCYVGRALDCAIRTDDAMVSRKHSMIRMEAGRFFVEDLGSSNGTHVNDVRVTKQELSHNDVVRCGSLWLRYIEENDVAAASPAPQPSMPKRGGTQRIDVPDSASASPPVVRPGRGTAGGYDGGAGAVSLVGVGARGPVQRSAAAAVAPMASPAASPEPAAPFGGPPAMPDGVVAGDLRPADRMNPPASGGPLVEVDLGDSPDVVRLRKDLADAQARLEELETAHDREVADGKRLRAEITTLKDRIDEVRRNVAEREEVVEAHARVADELRDELSQAKDGLASARTQQAELGDLVAARDRQLARSQDELGRLRDEIDEKNRQLADVARQENDGWKKLNDQLTEIEHLREVITQQERMLEERRVGLISQEQVIKELRQDKEDSLRQVAALKAERDEVTSDLGRLQARLAATDEENRRLGQLLADARSGDVGGADATQQITAELKNLKVALRTVEADRDHLRELRERTEAELDKAQELAARFEIEAREAQEERDRLRSSKASSDEHLTHLEVSAKRSADELRSAVDARTEAVEQLSKVSREVERLRRRILELEDSTDTGILPDEGVSERAAEAVARIKVLEAELAAAVSDAATVRGHMASLRVEADAQRAEADALRALAGAAPDQHQAATVDVALPQADKRPPTFDDSDQTAVVSATGHPARLVDRAVEVHDAVNDVLSEMRANLVILQDELSAVAAAGPAESARIMGDALEALLGAAEDAKGVLRGLKELIDFGND